MDKTLNPAEIEPRWYRFWMERRLFHADPDRGGDPYCVMIPPPNITGILHMGHALNNTVQDVLVRWRRMQGRNVLWMPGTDHAGIATQNVVERALRAEGKTRSDLGREAFVRRVWAWREQYGRTIIQQLQRLGCSCDWERERFTMDEGLSRAVTEVFVRLHRKGLIYRANYLIHWCPRCRTALSDEESEHREVAGRLYYLRYPLADGADGGGPGHVVVATTRPETLLGDTAVAVHPQDERYRGLIGRALRLPVLGRPIPIIADERVDPRFGTGAVKVTPAHDPNDFRMGQDHGLAAINVMNEDATMNAEAGPYAGLDRLECRRRILEDLAAAGRIEKVEEHRHAVGHCYRCDTVVEPRLSLQWFVRMKPLAEPAIRAVRDGRVVFVPERWTKVYLEWMENIRDWCISRQIWWGHRIPVFTCAACGHGWADAGRPDRCVRCRGGPVRQDEDVLDTWFSSWLWPFSTLGWPESTRELAVFYPTHDLVTASEIIFFWVARMIMAGCEFMGEVPFRTVYIHGTVRDNQGRKMSKSLGNAIDPLTVVRDTSADALRFTLMMMNATGQDVVLASEDFKLGRNFATKLWNAARFVLLQRPDGWVPRADSVEAEGLTADDRYLLARTDDTVRQCTQSLESYRFNEAARGLYELVWHVFCDWHLEYAKDDLSGPDSPRRRQALALLDFVLSRALRLLHPFVPFVTEELWHTLGFGGPEDSILTAPWPRPVDEDTRRAWGVTAEEMEYVEQKRELIRAGRTLRADYDIPPSARVRFRIKPRDAQAAARLLAEERSLRTLLRAAGVEVDADLEPGGPMPSAVARLGTVFLPLEGLIDVEAERRRLTAQQERARQEWERVRAKLARPDFVAKAPPAVVAGQRARERELQESLAKLQRMIDALPAQE